MMKQTMQHSPSRYNLKKKNLKRQVQYVDYQKYLTKKPGNHSMILFYFAYKLQLS